MGGCGSSLAAEEVGHGDTLTPIFAGGMDHTIREAIHGVAVTLAYKIVKKVPWPFDYSSTTPTGWAVPIYFHGRCESGLAQQIGPFRWNVRNDFEGALRTFQKAQDRQKMLGQYSALLSDTRLQFRGLQPGSSVEIEERVIAHVLDDVSDQPHVLIEGVDGAVYYLRHDAAIAAARANGRLKPNAFVQIHRADDSADSSLDVEDLSDAD